MSLDFAKQSFFSAIREAVASDAPPRKRLEELYAASLDKVHGNEGLSEDVLERVARLRENRGKLAQLSEREIKESLREIVSLYDVIAAHFYSSGSTKHT